MRIVLLFFALSVLPNSILSFKVLGVLPMASKSHYAIGYSIVDALYEAGHELTLITPFPSNKEKERYREISMKDLMERAEEEQKNAPSPFSFGKLPIPFMVFMLYYFGAMSVDLTMTHEGVKKLMESGEKFDVCVIEIFNNDAAIGLADFFECELVTYATFGAVSWIDEMTGNQSPSSYVPNHFSSYMDEMSFLERFHNTFLTLFEFLSFNLYHLPKQRSLYKQYFPNAKKSFDEMLTNSAMIFLNSHVSISSSRPNLPSVQEIAGIHVKEAKKLPENIQKFLNSATDGAILFTMGSFVKSQDFPEDTREAIVKAFAKLKQKVIWKYENETLPNKSDNVMISAWLPQRDILAHPNVKLFITHGGGLGTTEAIKEGVPLLGFPIFGDQHMNMRKAVTREYGRMIPFDQITEENLLQALNDLLNDPKYNKNAKELSMRFNDRPMTPKETVVYWTEYVVKHKGADHLKAQSRKLNFLQLNLIDVYGLMIVIGILVLYVDFLILKFFARKLFKKFSSKQKIN